MCVRPSCVIVYACVSYARAYVVVQVTVACGGHHTVAVTEEGQVVSWGWGNDGQLGHGDTYDQTLPTRVQALAGQRVTDVACGYYHTAAVNEDGAVMCWGKGSSGQLGLRDRGAALLPRMLTGLHAHRIRRVACGMAHTLALSDEGEVFAWGSGADGQLGVGQREPEQFDAEEPVKVQGLPTDAPVTVIAAGSRHSLCISGDDGQLFVWGNNADGRLGFADEGEEWVNRLVPTTPAPFDVARASGVAGGGAFSVVVDENGLVYTAGKGRWVAWHPLQAAAGVW